MHYQALLCAGFLLAAKAYPLHFGNLRRDAIHNRKAAKNVKAVVNHENNFQLGFRTLKARFLTVDRKTLLSIILTSSYMSIVLSVMSLPVCLSAIYADKSFLSASINCNLLSTVVSAGNFSNVSDATQQVGDGSYTKMTQNIFPLVYSLQTQMVGKFILGPPTDFFGGEKVLFITLLLSALFLFGCSMSHSIRAFGACWILFSFTFSAAWGAIGKVVRENFPKREWAVQLGMVYTGSRIGSMFAVLIFGSILRFSPTTAISNSNWRSVFQASSAIVLFVMTSIAVLLQHSRAAYYADYNQTSVSIKSTKFIKLIPVSVKSGLQAQSAVSNPLRADKNYTVERPENAIETLSRLVCEEAFWLVLVTKISSLSVRQFSTFLPFYLTTGYSMAPSAATFASASFAVSYANSSFIVLL